MNEMSNPTASSKNRAFRPMLPEKGFHRLKNDTQLGYLALQAKQLLTCLDVAIAATETAAPVRLLEPYTLNRDLRPGLDQERGVQEKHWEEALWRFAEKNTGQCSAAWRSITAYQVNLPNTRTDKGWGEIDLLGASESNLPVVIELKSNHGENLLRAVLEASAYCIALRKAWPVLGPQWSKRLGLSELSTDGVLSACPFVIAAPVSYWQACIGRKGKRTANKCPEDFWRVLPDLLFMLGQRGIIGSAVALLDSGSPDAGLPQITSIRAVDILTPHTANDWLWNP